MFDFRFARWTSFVCFPLTWVFAVLLVFTVCKSNPPTQNPMFSWSIGDLQSGVTPEHSQSSHLTHDHSAANLSHSNNPAPNRFSTRKGIRTWNNLSLSTYTNVYLLTNGSWCYSVYITAAACLVCILFTSLAVLRSSYKAISSECNMAVVQRGNVFFTL